MKIAEIIAKDPQYFRIVRNITRNDNDTNDLFQDLLLILLQYDQEKLQRIYNNNEFKFFFTRIALNQYRSDRSNFYNQYKKFSSKSNPLEDQFLNIPKEEEYDCTIDKVLEVIEEDLKKERTIREWYERNVFLSVIKEGSLRELERKTRISRTALTYTYKKYIGDLQKIVNERVPS